MSFFDADQEEDASFKVLSPGFYKFVCTDVAYGPNKKGTGTVLNVELTPEGYDEKVLHNFNIEHTNELARRIGRSELKKFCEISGRKKLAQPEELLGAVVYAQIVNVEYNGNEYANVKKFLTAEEHAAGPKLSGVKNPTKKKPQDALAGMMNQPKATTGVVDDGVPF